VAIVFTRKPKTAQEPAQPQENTNRTERRASQRTATAQVAVVSPLGIAGDFRDVLVTDISEGGLSFCSVDSLQTGSLAILRYQNAPDSKDIVVQIANCTRDTTRAIVVWRAGCRFV